MNNSAAIILWLYPFTSRSSISVSLFERLNAKDKYEGAGIGLAVAKKIAEKHDGLITAVSAEGRGAKFQIILPLKQKG